MKPGKLNKDQLQKVILSGIGFIILVYVYFSFFLTPLSKSRDAAQASIADLQAKLDSSQTETTKAANLEKQAGAATARFAAMKGLNPEGAPIAWFPPRMKIFFANQQIEKSSVRLEGSSAFKEPEMTEWSRFNWAIDLPQTDFATLGQALANLENSEPLLNITRLTIRVLGDDPQFQQVSLGASSVIMLR